MFPTAEVRWFYEGKVPPKLRSWFGKLPTKAELQPLRTDHYLLDSDTDVLGIKFREGRVEVKQRQGEPRLVSFSLGWEGYVERWRKWGFPLADARRHGKDFESFENWIAVEKKRRVMTYSISPKGKLIALPGDVGVACGCSIELAQVRIEKARWWSLGLEAKGKCKDLESTLEQVAHVVLNGSAPLKFEPADSLSYPGWLQIWNQRADALK